MARAAENANQPSPPLPSPGRSAQFSAVYEQYVGRVYGFVFSRVSSREEAEDVTSQVFLKAFNNAGQFEGRGSLEAWLYQIARITVADHWRQRYKLPAIPLPDNLDVAELQAPEDADRPGREARVRRLLAALPANYRDVLQYRFLQRWSIAETAQAMGVSEANAKVLQHRALRRAAELAKGWGWE